jgi:hypothetical protein
MVLLRAYNYWLGFRLLSFNNLRTLQNWLSFNLISEIFWVLELLSSALLNTLALSWNWSFSRRTRWSYFIESLLLMVRLHLRVIKTSVLFVDSCAPLSKDNHVFANFTQTLKIERFLDNMPFKLLDHIVSYVYKLNIVESLVKCLP